MDIKSVSKSTQKKLSAYNEKMQKKNVNPATANPKKKKKNSKKNLKADQKDNEQNVDGENQMFGIEGVGVLDNTAGDSKRASPDTKYATIQESGESVRDEGSLRGEGEDSPREDVSEVMDGANTLPQIVKPPQPTPSPSDPTNTQQKSARPQKASAKLTNRIPQGGVRGQRTGNKPQMPKSASVTTLSKRVTESLRWDQVLENEEEEEERIRIYKMNRRKRYLAAAQAKGLGWAANYRNNGSPMSEDSGIDTKDREWNNSSSTSDTHSAKSNRSARSNKSRGSSSDTRHTVTDFGTLKGLGPSQYVGMASSTLVDC
ncbi:uncharacterized protein LOC110461972 [Mizuhopecten yessoensis]|uniref:Uncharacterized protein C17orf97 n=1 Tax=Mizuhopecten yessoensis TaxID=6573 RepID=A0A210R2X2_MIZYE|nr:uncharacterized protein LOC110461972 [Mizuhopecten yessoensis]OWF55302.1 Uncharacterized protein C17orf97 [Mizuhopecten yessoensis]